MSFFIAKAGNYSSEPSVYFSSARPKNSFMDSRHSAGETMTASEPKRLKYYWSDSFKATYTSGIAKRTFGIYNVYTRRRFICRLKLKHGETARV